jgi:hypothetical protein
MDSILLEDVVVSIEPVYRNLQKRKRDGDEGQPAFFCCKDGITEQREIDLSCKENGNESKRSENISNERLNNDPSICSFQVAIVKRKVLSASLQKKDIMTTPDKSDIYMEVDDDGIDFNKYALLFRFGNYFVFEADAASLTVEYFAKEDTNEGHKQEEETSKDEEHQSKRQKTEHDKVDTSTEGTQPASLCISFSSCTFRVFSVQRNLELYGGKQAETILLNAKSKIVKCFDVGDNVSKGASYPFDNTNSEEWFICLDPKHQKDKVSPAKTDSSSTHYFENGQKQSSDLKAAGHNHDFHDHNDGEEKGNSETQPKDMIEINSSEKSSNGQNEKDTSEDIIRPPSFWNEISSRRQYFDQSWSQIQESVSNDGNLSNLTTCAQHQARSYCNHKQHAIFDEQADVEIENATNKIQLLIETMVPARGRGNDCKMTTSGTENEQSIDDLLSVRKDAIAAKYALFLVPKR